MMRAPAPPAIAFIILNPARHLDFESGRVTIGWLPGQPAREEQLDGCARRAGRDRDGRRHRVSAAALRSSSPRPGPSIAVLEIDAGLGAGGRGGARRRPASRRVPYPTDVAQSAQVDEAFAGVVERLRPARHRRQQRRHQPGRPSHPGRHGRGLARLDRCHADGGLLLHARGRADHGAAEIGLRDQHLVDPRLLAQPRPHDLQHAQGRGDHDDEASPRGSGRRTASA